MSSMRLSTFVVVLLAQAAVNVQGQDDPPPQVRFTVPDGVCGLCAPLDEKEGNPNLQQSPIKFTKSNTEFGALPGLNFNYGTPPVTLLDTGKPGTEKTIQGNIQRVQGANVNQSTVTVVPGEFAGTYNLRQFHFHAPAEHVSLRDIEYPMEVHLVHTQPHPAHPNNPDMFLSVLVIGAWLTDGSHQVYPPPPIPMVDPDLVKLFAHLPKNNKPVGDKVTMHLPSFDPLKLLPVNLNGPTYRYTGSLTTPFFDVPIRWIVYKTPVDLGALQIKAFKDLWLVTDANGVMIPQGNSRRLQKPRVNNLGVPLRLVKTDDPDLAPPPGPISPGPLAMP